MAAAGATSAGSGSSTRADRRRRFSAPDRWRRTVPRRRPRSGGPMRPTRSPSSSANWSRRTASTAPNRLQPAKSRGASWARPEPATSCGSAAAAASQPTVGVRRGQAGEHIDAAAGVDRLADQVQAVDGHQRLVPELPEHPHRATAGVAALEFAPTGLEGCRGLVALRGTPQQHADAAQRVGDALRLADLALVDRQAERAQARLVALVQAAVPNQNQVGLQLDDGFEVERERVAHDGQGARRRGMVAVADDASQGVAAARGKHDLGQVRPEADHPTRRGRQRDRMTVVVDHLRPGMGTCRPHGQGKREQPAPHADLGSKSHCAATWHCGHCGLRAWHT